ncbi:hypothetical protein [Corynebacterium pacaense]|uniref:hypothetical protein n=1 Tax=Corynebacterium pacaense TaxID=1816684 RepID=UPI0009BC591B|nr:hypothetical protein [Corynebacterium pacaense]
MSSTDSTLVLFSPTGRSPEEIRNLLVSLADEDGFTLPGAPVAAGHGAVLSVPEDELNDLLAWLDDVALAEGLGVRLDGATLRFGDEDVAFTVGVRGEDDARLGASRFGIEPTLNSLETAEDFITVTRFTIDDPANEEDFITARPLTGLDAMTLELGRAGEHSTTIVADAGRAATVVLRWMNGEDLSDLDWTRS